MHSIYTYGRCCPAQQEGWCARPPNARGHPSQSCHWTTKADKATASAVMAAGKAWAALRMHSTSLSSRAGQPPLGSVPSWRCTCAGKHCYLSMQPSHMC